MRYEWVFALNDNGAILSYEVPTVKYEVIQLTHTILPKYFIHRIS